MKSIDEMTCALRAGRLNGDLFSSNDHFARRLGEGRYLFEGDFPLGRTIVQAEIAAPYKNELTASEVEVCLAHPDFDCPDDPLVSSAACRLERRVVKAPRWTIMVASMNELSFTIYTYAAPPAPADGTAAVGSTDLADVDFHVMAFMTKAPVPEGEEVGR